MVICILFFLYLSMQHAWFKGLPATKGVLEELVQRSKKSTDQKAAKPAPAPAEVDSDDEGTGTIKAGAAKPAKQVLAQTKPAEGFRLVCVHQ